MEQIVNYIKGTKQVHEWVDKQRNKSHAISEMSRLVFSTSIERDTFKPMLCGNKLSTIIHFDGNAYIVAGIVGTIQEDALIAPWFVTVAKWGVEGIPHWNVDECKRCSTPCCDCIVKGGNYCEGRVEGSLVGLREPTGLSNGMDQTTALIDTIANNSMIFLNNAVGCILQEELESLERMGLYKNDSHISMQRMRDTFITKADSLWKQAIQKHWDKEEEDSG